MNEIKKYQFHISDSAAKNGYKDVPVFLDEYGTLSIEGYVPGYAYFSDLFLFSWEIDGKVITGNKYSHLLRMYVTEFLIKTNDGIYIKKITVGENANHQYHIENGCLVDNYHMELCLITEECKELNLKEMKNVRHIGEHAGASWQYEGTLTIPETIMSIKNMAFYESKISNLVFSWNSEEWEILPLEINKYAFFMCEKLENVDFGKRNIEIYDQAFSYSGIKKIDIPKNVEIKEGGMQELLKTSSIRVHCEKIPPRAFLSTGRRSNGGCTINMEDVENIELDRNYDAVFKNSILDRVIMSPKLYSGIIRAGVLKSWVENVPEIDVVWYYGSKTGKITEQKR